MTNTSLSASRPLTRRSAWTRAVGAVAVLFVVNLVALELLMLISTLAHWSSDVHTRAEVAFGSAIIGEVVFLVLLIWWLHREHLTLDDLGLRKRPKAWAVLVAVAFAVAYGLLTASNPGLRPNLGLHDFLKAEAVVAAVVAGIVEEVVSRGYFMFELQRARVPAWLQIVGSGLVFGIAHFNYSVYGVASAALLGLVFGAIYHFGKRSLAPVIAGHAVIDLIIEPALILWVLSGFPIPH
jgi:membrane protease YdiL (CAAX protease family)